MYSSAASSMPCDLPPDAQIPIGQYGTSNVGQAKRVLLCADPGNGSEEVRVLLYERAS